MRHAALPLGILAAALFSSVCAAQNVVINEFVYDDGGNPDDREFVELYNAGNAAVNIGNWVLDASGASASTGHFDYTIPSGTMLAAGAYYVIGSAAVANVNQTVSGTAPSQNLWDDDNDSITLRNASGVAIDSVVYEANKGLWPGAPVEGYPIWGNMQDTRFNSWSRLRDGFDTDNNGRDFRIVPETPGASNDHPNLLPTFENFDALPASGTNGSFVPNWAGTFVAPLVIDPTMVDTFGANQAAVPASPQGGNAAIFWDPAGGGNSTMLLTDPVREIALECYVYIDPTLLPDPADYYVWSIGVQGGSATFFNSPDPGLNLGGLDAGMCRAFKANGNTGVSWTLVVTAQSAVLYLVDHNSGGWSGMPPCPDDTEEPETILGQIDLTGTSAGWQRLSLRATGCYAEGRFGGTFGATDGQFVAGNIAAAPEGGVYVSCREAVLDNTLAQPPRLDQLIIVEPSGALIPFGEGTPTTMAQPKICGNSWPSINNSSFAVQVRDIAPAGPAALLLSFAPLASPIDVSFIGTQPDVNLYLNPVLSVVAPSNQGVASFPLPLPNNMSLVGGSLFFQGVTIDAALPYSIGVASTSGLQVVIGR